MSAGQWIFLSVALVAITCGAAAIWSMILDMQEIDERLREPPKEDAP